MDLLLSAKPFSALLGYISSTPTCLCNKSFPESESLEQFSVLFLVVNTDTLTRPNISLGVGFFLFFFLLPRDFSI